MAACGSSGDGHDERRTLQSLWDDLALLLPWIFAGYATAFRAPFGFIGTQAAIPETSSNIESGVKLALPKAGLSGTIAVFRQTHDNVVTADPANVGFYVQRGRQRASGVEVDLIRGADARPLAVGELRIHLHPGRRRCSRR